MDFVWIPGGEFQMGSDRAQIADCVRHWQDALVDKDFDRRSFQKWIEKEYPPHQVRLSGFHIGRFPVTNEEFQPFAKETACNPPESILIGEPARHPVWGVEYELAVAFCDWLGQTQDRRCRLPKEAEWEYSARGPSQREYPFGNVFDPSRCNTIEGGIGRTTPVDTFESGKSEFGVWDMAGNIEEWTCDWYAPYPGGAFIKDDLWNTLGQYKVVRGGSFALGGDLARCARRHGPFRMPVYRYRGFRVVCD